MLKRINSGTKRKRCFLFVFFCLILLFCGCGKETDPDRKILHISINKLLATLDPALAADSACQSMTAAFYDTPLQYSFTKRPYTLEPAMLESMPELSADGKTLTCRLKNGLLFQKAPCFTDDSQRKITSSDVIFSILRLADTRVRSTGFWLIRGKIQGIDSFRERTLHALPNDYSPYDGGCPGLERVDDLTFRIHLNAADPRFVYAMAMPYFSVVSRRAVEFYGEKFADHPCGSGPFILAEYARDHQLRLVRNSEFRKEYFPGINADPLPLCDEIVCNLIKQPMSGWLLFLQGELDICSLSGETAASVVNEKRELPPTLQSRGIQLICAPEFEINYIGFSFTDPLLAKNENLRKAVSLAFDRDRRIRHSGGKLFPAYGPVPPDTVGYLPAPGPFSQRNLELAKEYMKKAGFPDGIDPATGKPLELTFDQAGSDTFYLQTAELLAMDMKEIGITLKPEFNNRARFLQKLALGQVQLFRLSWTGDYPDAENFLQLFYGPNAGGSNRAACRFPDFDRKFETIRSMGPSADRDRIYQELALMVREKCPWIFESYPMSFQLKHCWADHFDPHPFAFNRWKYYTVNPRIRAEKKASFRPLALGELRGEK